MAATSIYIAIVLVVVVTSLWRLHPMYCLVVRCMSKEAVYTEIYPGMCPQWSAVVGTDHHSEKIATTQIK